LIYNVEYTLKVYKSYFYLDIYSKKVIVFKQKTIMRVLLNIILNLSMVKDFFWLFGLKVDELENMKQLVT